MFKNIRFENSAGIAKIVVDRPTVMNALNEETLHEIQECLNQIQNPNSNVQVVILTGAGEKSFIAGADIIAMKDKNPHSVEPFIRLGQGITEQLEALPQPVIAAVNGYALGGGCELAMACDWILAAENAVFGQPEVALGIIPFFGGCYRLQRRVGQSRAKELIFTGRKFSAKEAWEMGLVLEVMPLSLLLTRAEEMAQQIQTLSSSAIAQTKKAIHQLADFPTSEGLLIEAKMGSNLFGTHDQREGMNAFAEKRKPVFTP